MDQAFGFQTVDVRSNPTRFFFLSLVILFIYFILFYYYYFFFIYLFTYILAFFLGYFLIKHEILNFARAKFECTLSFVSLLFIYFDFFFELKKYMQCVYKASENNDNIKKQ